MPQLINPIYPSDPVQPIGQFYNQILADSFSRIDEDGGVHDFEFEVRQFLPDSTQTYDDPLGLTGDVIYKMGADGNAIDKVINPTQVQFRVRNDSGLLERMRGANTRDFQLVIRENGQTIFHGYILLKTKKHEYYQKIPEVELRAYDGLALLADIPVSNFPLDYSGEPPVTVKEFLSTLERQMGIQLGWVVHTNFNDPASDSHFPLGYEFKIGELIRGLDKKERTWGKALELFARNHFGLQVYQWGGKWHLIGRAERATSPQAITTIDMDSGAVSTGDFSGPQLDSANAIRFPSGQVVSGLGEVRGELQLGDGFLRNEGLAFDSGAVPYWTTSDVSDVQAGTTFEQVLQFNTIGSSSASQLTKTVLESRFNPPPGYRPRFTVSVEVEILTKDQPAGTDEVALNVDLFQLQTVDPGAVVDDQSVYARLFEGGKPGDDNEQVYYNSITIPSDDAWFSVRVDKKRDGQSSYLAPAISASASFKCALQTPGTADEVRRYLRILFQPRASADQGGGNGDLLDGVNLVSVRIRRDEPSAQKEYASQTQPTSAPNYSRRTDRFTGKNQGKSLTLQTALSNKDTYNGLFLFNAPQGGSVLRVGDLQHNGIAFPRATTRARMAMQAVDLERVRLQTRGVVGTSPLQALDFVAGGTTTLRIIPIAWKRVLTSDMVSITAVEARFDEDRIDTETIYGPVDSAGGGDEFAGSSSGGGGVAIGSGGGSGITDHGHLDGLGDDDHKQYFNEERGDARYYTRSASDARFLNESDNLSDLGDRAAARINLGLGPTDTPALGQVQLNNPASASNHAVRAGKAVNVSAPLKNTGNSLLDPINLSLGYTARNLKVSGGLLDTVQDIDEDAQMILKSLMLKTGLTITDFLQSVDLTGFDWISKGFGIKKQPNGDWDGVLDNISIRKRAKFRELLFEEIITFSKFLLNESNKVDSVEEIGTGEQVWTESTEEWATSTATWLPVYRCFIEKDARVQLAPGDLVQRQAFSGTSIGVTQAIVVNVEQGAVDLNDNSTARYFDIAIDNGTPPVPGQTFARLGNLSDPTRQGGIYFAGSGEGAPHSFMYDGVNRFDKFGTPETIKDFRGNTEGRVFPDFPALDGNQGRLFATITQDGYFKGKAVFTGGSGISNFDDAGLLATLDDLDAVPDGGQYGKVKLAALSSEGLIALSETIGTADDISEGATAKFAGQSGADVTAANPQGQSWLTDSSSLVNENDSINRLTGRVLDNIADGATYARVRSASLSAGKLLLSEAVGTVDDIGDGSTYGRVRQASLSAGRLLLSEGLGNLSDIVDGGGYGKVKSASLSAGKLLLSEAVGGADDIAESGARKWAGQSGADVTASNPQGQSWLTDSGALINENDSINRLTGRVLDNIADGATYARVRSASLSAGQLLLSEAVGTVDDIGDGSTYGRVRQASLSAGRLLLSEAVGNLGNVADGGGYAKVRSTAVSAGLIELSETAGTLDDVAEGGTEVWTESTEQWAESTATWTGTFGRVRQSQLRAGYIEVKGPSGRTIISEGVLDTNELFTEDADISATLTMQGASRILLPDGGNGRGQIDENGIDLPYNQSYTLGVSAASGLQNPLDLHYDQNTGETVFATDPSIGFLFDGPVRMATTFQYTTTNNDNLEIGIESPVVALRANNGPAIAVISSTSMTFRDGMTICLINEGSNRFYLKDQFSASVSGANIRCAGNSGQDVLAGSFTWLIYYGGSFYAQTDYGQ